MNNANSIIDNSKYKLISIESRKGGVGKTTIAMNLAKVLRKIKYSVLVIDCDIIGTSISGATHSDFFKEEVVELLDYEGNPINLIGYYQKQYLKGNNDASVLFQSIGSDQNKNKIFVLESDLFDSDNKLIIHPSLLMDEIHSFWFVQMLKNICGLFTSRFDSRCAIILDNSPGFISLNSAIHHWMAEIGPKDAKYVLVSSIDKQDLESNLDSANEIKETIDLNNRVLNYFYSLKNPSVVELDTKEENFLLSNNKAKEYLYYLLSEGNNMEKTPTININASSYLNMIFNKVPEDCQEDLVDRLASEVLSSNSESRTELLKMIAKNKKGEDNIVLYEDVISKQYYTKFYTDSIKLKIDPTYWKQRISTLITRNESLIQSEYDTIKKGKEVGSLYDSLQKSLFNRAPKNIYNTFNSKWSPSVALDDFSALFPILKRNANRLFMTDMQNINYNGLFQRYYTIFKSFINKNNLSNYVDLLSSFFDYVNESSDFHDDNTNRSPIILGPLLFMCFIKSCESQLVKYNSFKAFLLSEIKENKDKVISLADIMGFLDGFYYRRNTNSFKEILNDLYTSFYKKLCYAMIKTIDMHKDFDLVLTWINGQLVNPSINIMSKKTINQYLTNVIVDKTEEGNKLLLSIMMQKGADIISIEKTMQSIVYSNWSMKQI